MKHIQRWLKRRSLNNFVLIDISNCVLYTPDNKDTRTLVHSDFLQIKCTNFIGLFRMETFSIKNLNIRKFWNFYHKISCLH